MKNRMQERKGFALVMVILGLVVISILGFTIVGVTTSNLKMTKVDSRSQSAYYIAEAGVNKAIDEISKTVDKHSKQLFNDLLDEYANDLSKDKLTNDELIYIFFDRLDVFIDKGYRLAGVFEENFQQKPLSIVTVTRSIDQNGIYHISSIGEIGSSKRKLNASIEIKPEFNIENNEFSMRHPAFKHAIYSGQGINFLKTNEGQASIIDGSIYANGKGEIGSYNTINGSIYSARNDVVLSNGNQVNGWIYSKDKVNLGDNNIVEGWIYSGKNGASIGNNNNVHKFIYSNNGLSLGRGNKIGDWLYSQQGNINLSGLNTINGKNVNQYKYEDSNLQEKPAIPTPNYENTNDEVPLLGGKSGNKDIYAKGGIIPPGEYQDLIANNGDSINFTNGNYYFSSIKASNNNITLQLDLSKGPINVFAKNDIIFGSKLRIEVLQKNENKYTEINHGFFNTNRKTVIDLAGSVYWEAGGNEFRFPGSLGNGYFLGTILSRNNITNLNETRLVGSITTNGSQITVGQASEIIYAPPTTSAAGNNGNTENSPGTGESSSITGINSIEIKRTFTKEE